MPGQIQKRGENTYRLTVSLGFDIRGKRIRRSKTVHCSEAQAKKELAKFYTECSENNVASTSVTLTALCNKWMQEYAEPKLKHTTLTGYRVILRNNIIPIIGHNKVSKLTPVHMQEWINLLHKENLSPKTIRNSFSLLHKIFDTAVIWRMVASNPCVSVELPKQRRTESKYYNKEQVALLLEKLETVSSENLSHKVAVLLALFSGMRLGEVMGLMWQDINFESGSISIERTRYYSPTVGSYIDTTKSEGSDRVISVPKECIELLRELKQQQRVYADTLLNKWTDSGFVIVNEFGAPAFPQLPYVWFKRFIRKHQLNDISFHGLRHTHTSLLYHLNINVAQISKRLGHSQISTTQNIYTHIFNDIDKEISDQMSDYLKK